MIGQVAPTLEDGDIATYRSKIHREKLYGNEKEMLEADMCAGYEPSK